MQRCLPKPKSRNSIRPHLDLNQDMFGSWFRKHFWEATSTLFRPSLLLLSHKATLLFLLSRELPPQSRTQTRWPMENSQWPPCSPATAPATSSVPFKFPEKRFHLPSVVQSSPAGGQSRVCKFIPRNTLRWAGRGGGIVNFADIPKAVCLCQDHKQGSLFQTSIITSPEWWSPEQSAISLTLKGCFLSKRDGNIPGE